MGTLKEYWVSGVLPPRFGWIELQRGGRKSFRWKLTVSVISLVLLIAANAGAGLFTSAAYYVAGNIPVQLAVADLDGNGTTDLVIANEWSDHLSVLLDSSGIFTAGANIPADSGI